VWQIVQQQKGRRQVHGRLEKRSMYAGKAQIENIVPPGDRGEQLIANLILAIVASELHDDATPYVAQAHALALDLAGHSLIYRPLKPSMFARLTCEIGGEAETILLPVINDMLVVPAMAAERFAGGHGGYAVTVTNLEIVHFMLRLRPQRLMTVLESLKGTMSREHLNGAARRILRSCMHHELPPGEPLDRASHYFTLARDLIGKRNFSLAALALHNADRALDAYVDTSSIRDDHEILESMKDRIRGLLRELKQTAM
jgi:hypothetical protein